MEPAHRNSTQMQHMEPAHRSSTQMQHIEPAHGIRTWNLHIEVAPPLPDKGPNLSQQFNSGRFCKCCNTTPMLQRRCSTQNVREFKESGATHSPTIHSKAGTSKIQLSSSQLTTTRVIYTLYHKTRPACWSLEGSSSSSLFWFQQEREDKKKKIWCSSSTFKLSHTTYQVRFMHVLHTISCVEHGSCT